MNVKIIEIIEVTDYVDDERTGEAGVPTRIRERKRYYLRDGAPLELADPFKPEPARPHIHIHHHEDGSVSASTIGSH